MIDFSIPLAFLTACSVSIAALSTAAWTRSRRSLAASLRERKELEKSTSLLDVESHIMERMNEGASLTEVLDILTHAIEELMPGCLCTVLQLDDEHERLWEGSRGSLPEEYIRAVNGLIIGPEVGACGSAAYRNETTVVEDVATDPRFAAVKDFVMSFGLRACWSVPIRGANNTVLGTFAMYHRRPAKPKHHEMSIVEAGAHLAANAIERLRAHERLKENAGRIALAEKAASLGVWEFDFTSRRLTLSRESAVHLGLPDAAQQLAARQLRALIHPDDWRNARAAHLKASFDHNVFHAEFRVLLGNGSIRWLRSQARIELLDGRPTRMVGVMVDITTEKEILEDLHFRAAHDGLTGAWNRTAIVALMHREFEVAARLGSSTGVMMLDLDHFKEVNDTFGHPVGDTVLKDSARRLHLAVRSYDLVGRYGGEEFLVVLPRCDDGQLARCAERIRIAFEHEPMVVHGRPLRITISGGWTVVDPLMIGSQGALAAADAALYRAKSSGRNRIVSEDGFGAVDLAAG